MTAPSWLVVTRPTEGTGTVQVLRPNGDTHTVALPGHPQMDPVVLEDGSIIQQLWDATDQLTIVTITVAESPSAATKSAA
jgi:hypothetical protein